VRRGNGDPLKRLGQGERNVIDHGHLLPGATASPLIEYHLGRYTRVFKMARALGFSAGEEAADGAYSTLAPVE
jgi:hypothetical protein